MAGEDKDKLQIRIHVYDTDMSVKIPREDEEYYRKAAKLITDTVNKYAARFVGKKSDKEFLYMALIEIALICEKNTARTDAAPFNDILAKLTSEIEEVL